MLMLCTAQLSARSALAPRNERVDVDAVRAFAAPRPG